MNFISTPLPLLKVLTPATPLHMWTEHSIRVHSIRHPRIPTLPPPSCGGSAASSSVIHIRKTTKSTKNIQGKKEKKTRLFSCKGRKWRNTPLPRSLMSWRPPATWCPVAAALDVDAYTFGRCIKQHTAGKWWLQWRHACIERDMIFFFSFSFYL